MVIHYWKSRDLLNVRERKTRDEETNLVRGVKIQNRLRRNSKSRVETTVKKVCRKGLVTTCMLVGPLNPKRVYTRKSWDVKNIVLWIVWDHITFMLQKKWTDIRTDVPFKMFPSLKRENKFQRTGEEYGLGPYGIRDSLTKN